MSLIYSMRLCLINAEVPIYWGWPSFAGLRSN
jgi:hypothetical protein